MHLNGIPFGITDWQAIRPSERAGETGFAQSRVREFGGVRVRLVEYSAGYRADHWCSKGADYQLVSHPAKASHAGVPEITRRSGCEATMSSPPQIVAG